MPVCRCNEARFVERVAPEQQSPTRPQGQHGPGPHRLGAEVRDGFPVQGDERGIDVPDRRDHRRAQEARGAEDVRRSRWPGIPFQLGIRTDLPERAAAVRRGGGAIKDALSQKLADYNLFVDGFSVIDFSFSKKFTDAIESKQEAEQFALRAQRDLERIKIEAEQKIAQAKAEAESLRLQKGQITTEMIELRKIEAMREAITKWNGTVPNVLLSGGGATPLLSLNSLMKK